MESRHFFWDRDIGQDRGIETWDEARHSSRRDETET